MRTAPRAIEKAVQFQPETVSSFSQNRCPVWPEYACKKLKEHLAELNEAAIQEFLSALKKTLDRTVEYILVIPMHGDENQFHQICDAIKFITNYDATPATPSIFRKYELIVSYTNGDKIEASFQDKTLAEQFLHYVGSR